MKIVKILFITIFFSVILIYGGLFIFGNAHFIKDLGLSIYAWVNKQNQMIAGAISLWLLGTLSYVAKDIPNRLRRFIVKQSTVTLTFNSVDDVYSYFLLWYHSTGRSKKSRTLIGRNKRWEEGNLTDNNIDISAGYGTHYFFFGGRVFQFSRNEKEANNTIDVKESIVLTTIGRSQSQFHKLIDEIIPKHENEDTTSIYKWRNNDRYWRKFHNQKSRPFDSVILPSDIKTLMVEHIETFLKEKDWYISNGIPYRTGIILHGIPGTGKTSAVNAICTKFNKPLYILSLSGMTDDTLNEAFNEMSPNSILLIEDIDTYDVATNRNDDGMSTSLLQMLTLSGLLNAIDGVLSSFGRIIIATTNYIEKLDPAIIRKGRFNLCVKLDYLTEDSIRQFFEKFYPDFIIDDSILFKQHITPAELQSYILDNRYAPENVLNKVIKDR